MHRARQHAETRSREARQRVAREAARLMADSGMDLRQARRKAAARLGIDDEASLPGGAEIEEALREHQRLFVGAAHGASLRQRRHAALSAMDFFASFDPRLVGAVLDGTAGVHAPVSLQLHADDPDAVARCLDERGIPAEDRSRSIRLDPQRTIDAPVWLFGADDIAFDITVLPTSALRQAPLSSVDGKAVKRASAAQLRALMAEDAENDATRDQSR